MMGAVKLLNPQGAIATSGQQSVHSLMKKLKLKVTGCPAVPQVPHSNVGGGVQSHVMQGTVKVSCFVKTSKQFPVRELYSNEPGQQGHSIGSIPCAGMAKLPLTIVQHTPTRDCQFTLETCFNPVGPIKKPPESIIVYPTGQQLFAII